MTAPAKPRAHLGVGWAFPVRPVAGRLTYARYEDDVEQAIGIILETTRRERVMRPAFGTDLRNFVFDANSPNTHRAIEHEVEGALRQWEPRIDVQRVRAFGREAEPNLVMIEIDYVVRRNNSSVNLVYPFYLREGV
ncbi:MAG: GPW/gp25 family protein [Kofleriaceae bacterium]